MAVIKQLKSIPFTQGSDTKTDPILSGKPSRLENRVFRGGTPERRYGTKTIPATIDTGGNQSAGEALFAFNNELVRVNGGSTYGFSDVAQEWVTKTGTIAPAIVSRSRIQRNSRTQSSADMAAVGNVIVFAWSETAAPQQGIHVAVYDASTGTFFQTGNSALTSTSNGVYPCCVALGKCVVVMWRDTGGSLYTASYDTTKPETVPTPFQLQSNATNATTNAPVLMAYDIDFAVYAYSTSATDFTVGYIDATGHNNSAGGAAPTAFPTMGTNISSMLALQRDTAGNIYLVWTDRTALHTGITKMFVMAKVLSGTVTQILSYSSSVASMLESSTNQLTVVLFGSNAQTAAAGKYFCQTIIINSAGIVTGAATLPGTYGVVPVTQAFWYQGTAAIGVAHLGSFVTTQPTAWVIDFSGRPLARVLSGFAGTTFSASGSEFDTFPRITTPISVDGPAPSSIAARSTKLPTSCLFYERERLTYSSNRYAQTIDVTPLGLTMMTFSPVSAGALPVSRVGETVLIGGSNPVSYDGERVVEAGFPIPPVVALQTSTGSGSLSAGQYQLRLVASWTDARGQLVRSPPSPALTWTAAASDSQAVSIQPLQVSARDVVDSSSPVQVEVYRTEANGLDFYRDSSASSVVINSTTGLTSYTTTQADSTLIAGELLYTSGGVGDWVSPPPHSASCAHQDRFVIVGLEDPYAFRTSSQAIPGEFPRFNEDWGGRVPSSTGKLVACASLDGSLVLFAERGAYVVPGSGPDLLGNNPWLPPQEISSVKDGPVSRSSVVATPNGIMFQGSQGWLLLDRGLNCQFIGADVEMYGAQTVRCATYRPEVQQVWLHCDTGSDLMGALYWWAFDTGTGGTCLVYDFFYNQWSVLTNYGAQAACYYEKNYARVRSDGAVFQEQPGTFLDSGVSFSSTVETHWIKVSGLQGFQRIWRALLLGAYGGPSTDFSLNWEIAYNYGSEFSSAYAETFASAGVFASDGAFQVRRHMPVQKCQAIKFRLTDTPVTGSNGQGMSLTELTLEVGLKKGAFKLPAAQSI